ncbi:MAG: type II toxin-antitoxin system Phd/YefM family antitoxin [Betaproteobacteria bacterium]|nr:type II toxin-antitoxin system Phd/YefM family antitoxin [Betaproteobacteria bacterium]
MEKRISIAQAKDHFSELVQTAERGGVVTVTRRGQAVARLVSEEEYQRLTRRKGGIDWGDKLVDLSGFRFDREDANTRR